MQTNTWIVLTTLLAVCVVGCVEPESETHIVVSTDTDFGHQHRHQHGPGHAHEHEHQGFEGGHTHPHEHGHRHSKAVHGGKVISIAHTNHSEAKSHYHAEAIRTAGEIRIHLESNVDAAKASSIPSENPKLVGFIHSLDSESAEAYEVEFHPMNQEIGGFSAELPEQIRHCRLLSVLVTNLHLDGKTLRFSFTLAASDQEHPE